MRTRPLAVVALAAALVGSITLSHGSGGGALDPTPVETPFGALAPGASVGLNATNASASITGTLLATTTDLLFLNHTNATAAAYARIEAVSATGLTNLLGLEVGLDNGTRTAQITASLGNLTTTGGALVRFEPGSVNRIYVTSTVATLGLVSTITFRVVVADDPQERAYVVTRGTLHIT